MSMTEAERRSLLGLPPAPTGTVDGEDRSTWLGLVEFQGDEVTPPTEATRRVRTIELKISGTVTINLVTP